MTLVPPFPYFGGKRRVADIVWQALGDVATYCEPFAGGAAVLLGRPAWHRRGEWHEVLNDIDGHVTNAWRAIQADPDGVWRYCNRPHSEHDLTAWRAELSRRYGSLVEQLEADPRWYDVEAAGVWVWGQCVCVGAGWAEAKRPVVGRAKCGAASPRFYATADIANRLRGVSVLRGDWRRSASIAATYSTGSSLGYFLDPPYSADRDTTYAHDCRTVAHDVREWAIEAGGRPEVRIVLCGYGDEHSALDTHGWRTYNWKASGGYGNKGNGRGRANSHREVLWLSPACLPLESERQRSLF